MEADIDVPGRIPIGTVAVSAFQAAVYGKYVLQYEYSYLHNKFAPWWCTLE